jgi:dGTPase
MIFQPNYHQGDERDSFKSIECQIMDWADDTAYSLNDLADSVRAGFLTVERIERWAESRGHEVSDESPLGGLLKAIRGQRIEPFVGKRIGKYIQSVTLVSATNLLSGNQSSICFGFGDRAWGAGRE